MRGIRDQRYNIICAKRSPALVKPNDQGRPAGHFIPHPSSFIPHPASFIAPVSLQLATRAPQSATLRGVLLLSAPSATI